MKYNRNRFIEGEIDFIVIVPNKGLVLLEVKSSKQYRLTATGVWERFDESSSRWIAYPKSPWEQVTKNKHALIQILQGKSKLRHFPCGYGAAVVFPRAVMQGRLPAGEDDPAMIIEATEIKNFSKIIRDILEGWWEGEGKTEGIKMLLCPPEARFSYSLSLGIQQQNREIIKLTQRQLRVFQGLKRHNMVQVLGKAGTGKTILGLELAKEAVGHGQRVLFLCYSRGLASWVASTNKSELLLATNFHRLARQYIMSSSLKWPSSPDDEFWRIGVCELFLQAICKIGKDALFDTIIVDEAQDFIGEWLILVRELWNESGRIVFFGDENQTLFGGQLFEHAQVVKYTLQDNCRNSKYIAMMCNNILKDAGVNIDADSFDMLPEGNTPRIAICGSLDDRRLTVIKQLQQWIHEGLYLSQIAVLSPWNDNNTLGLGNEDEVIKGIKFTRHLDTWRGGKACLFETIKGFKGLEADAVILIDVNETSAGFTLQDAYVACSRAKHELLIVPVDNKASKQFTRWLQF
jgi:hypothetical protein